MKLRCDICCTSKQPRSATSLGYVTAEPWAKSNKSIITTTFGFGR